MAINVGMGFKVGNMEPIDARFVMSKAEMLAVTPATQPDIYFCVCSDDSLMYVYDSSNSEDATTGKFRCVSTGAVDMNEYQKVIDDALTTVDKTVPGAINELLNLINEKVALPELDGVENDVLTRDADGNVIWKAIPDVDLSGKLDKPEVDGAAGQILVLQDDGSLAYQDNVSEYDDTEIRELIDTKISKPETEGTTGQVLTVQEDGTIAYQDVPQYDDTKIQEAVDNKLNKPVVDGSAGQILVLQDDGSLAYQDNVTEFDDTAIQEELDNKLNKEKVVQNLDTPDTESVLSTEALNTVLETKVDKVEGSSLVPDTKIAKIHEHANQDVLDKLSDDGNGKLLYDSNPISVDVPVATVDVVGTVKPDGTTITIDENGVITAVGGGEGGASTADAVEYVNNTIGSTNVEEALNKLIADYYYVAPSVTSFTATPTGGIFEVGHVVSAPITFNWNYNKDITTQTLTDCTLADETVRTATYDTDITANKTFTLNANDGKNNVSKSISYTFVNPFYVGVSTIDTLIETDVIALTKKVETKGNKTINYTTAQSYMVFAYPKSYGAIKSVIDQNGFNVTDSFTQNTVTVNGVNYYVYVSNKCSGSYTISYRY